MLKFSANLGLLFTELPFIERFKAARIAGFTAVEFPFAEALRPAELAALLREFTLEQSLANMPYMPEDLGLAAAPGREIEFRQRLAISLDYASATGCRTLHVLAGRRPNDVSDEQLEATLLRNLDFAAVRAAERGIDVVIEAINRRDVPDFALASIHHAANVVRTVDLPNLRVLLDLYHVGTVGESVPDGIRAYGPDAGYVQIAGFLSRNEPDDGAADYRDLLSQLYSAGYKGYVGCEYRPRRTTLDGLEWMAKFV